jgi:hypothetical protein
MGVIPSVPQMPRPANASSRKCPKLEFVLVLTENRAVQAVPLPPSRLSRHSSAGTEFRGHGVSGPSHDLLAWFEYYESIQTPVHVVVL